MNKTLRVKRLASAVGMLSSILAASAMANDRQDENIDEVIIWGTEVRASSTSLHEESIALRQADHLSDLLRVIPGVDVGGTHSVNSRINIRGLDDRELNIYIDGALQTNYLFHHIGNLLINADILKSADIQLGANSVTNGGIGGAVRFETKSAADLLRNSDQSVGARLMTSYNDNDKTAYSITGFAQLSDKVDGLIYFQREDRGNFEDGSGRSTIGSDGETDNFLAKMGFTPSENQRLQLSYDKLVDEGDYTARPDMGVLTNDAITGDLLLPTEYERETGNVSYLLDLGEKFNLDATYYINEMSLYRDESDPAYRTQTGNARKQVDADNHGLNLLASSSFNFADIENTFVYGLNYFHQELSFDSDLDADGPVIEQEADSMAVFVENSIQLTEALMLRPGLRYNEHEVEYKATGESADFDELTYGLAGELAITQDFELLASYTEIFQGPELAEPFTGAGSNKIANSELEAEEGENTEFGFRYSKKTDSGRISFGATRFKTTIDGYIGEVGVEGSETGETQDANLGSIEIDGYELSFQASVANVDFFLSYNNADFDTDDVQTAGLSESFREVGDTTAYELAYNFEQIPMTLSINGQFIQDKTTSLDEEKEGYNVHNLSGRWTTKVGDDLLELTFGIDNIFDETYTSHASRVGNTVHPVFGALFLNDVEPGRNMKVTVSYQF